MSAAKIPDTYVPIARTDSDWSFDIDFTGEDWTGSGVSVAFVRRGQPACSFEASVDGGLETPTAELSCALRIPAATWADKTPGVYSVQVRKIDGAEADDAAVFTVKLVRGLSDLIDPEASTCEAPAGDGTATGGVIINRAGSVAIIRSAGVRGPTGPPGVTIGPTFTGSLETGAQALWVKTGLGDGGNQMDLIIVTGE